MTIRVHKVILTNRSALSAKYANLAQLDHAVGGLVAADKARGLTTRLVAIDDVAAMKALGAVPVTDPQDGKQNKVAVDGVFRALRPPYLLLLGSIDVIPHQALSNPMPPDGDDEVFGDLPYACEHGYSRNVADFNAPTRVVGRLPDRTGGSDPSHIIRLLNTAAQYRARPRADFTDYLGISAKELATSTALSLGGIFGAAGAMKTSPAAGPKWTPQELGFRSHFINCHGYQLCSRYYGHDAHLWPVAHDAANLAGRVSDGTVVAAECCYGAQLFDPSQNGITKGQAAMCDAYLAEGAYGFFGSSTASYGSLGSNSGADLITQFFLRHVLSGASLGRAALQARQDFVWKGGISDPCALKALGQFNLMGDPSVHPVMPTRASSHTPTSAAPNAAPPVALALLGGLTARRTALARNGLAVGGAAETVITRSRRRTASKRIRSILRAAVPGAKALRYSTYSVAPPGLATTRAFKLLAAKARRPTVHVATGHLVGPVGHMVAVVAREEDGIVTVKKYVTR